VGGDTIGRRFAEGANAFHVVRLLLAVGVIAVHSVTIRGDALPSVVDRGLTETGVDAFFVLSGFLVAAAWTRQPDAARFALARLARLMPAMWGCLVVTAFAIVPVACWVAGQPVPGPTTLATYVGVNAGGQLHQPLLGDTTAALPTRGWNLTLWTLSWELRCYLVLVVGAVLGLLRPRVVLGCAVALWAVALGLELSPAGPLLHVVPEVYWMPQRAGLVFALGVAAWLYRDRIPMSSRLALVAAASLVVGVVVCDNYRVVGAPGLAYLVVWCGLALGRWRATQLVRSDLSYGLYLYGYPVQQALVMVGLGVGWAAFTLVSIVVTVPLAVLSWYAVERPAHRAVRRLDARAPAPVTAPSLRGLELATSGTSRSPSAG
jgi:peptidoglycan/LPS O-acetylase OafA/YrhL